jgi:hypothetical protein
MLQLQPIPHHHSTSAKRGDGAGLLQAVHPGVGIQRR